VDEEEIDSEEDENANDQQEDEFFEDFSLYDSAQQPEN